MTHCKRWMINSTPVVAVPHAGVRTDCVLAWLRRQGQGRSANPPALLSAAQRTTEVSGVNQPAGTRPQSYLKSQPALPIGQSDISCGQRILVNLSDLRYSSHPPSGLAKRIRYLIIALLVMRRQYEHLWDFPGTANTTPLTLTRAPLAITHTQGE